MNIGVLKEGKEERRVSLIPGSVKKLTDLGFIVGIEKGAGSLAFFTDEDYKTSGAKIVARKDVLAKSHIILSIDPIKKTEWSKIKKGSFYLSSFKPYSSLQVEKELYSQKFYALSLDMIPRTSVAQSMDILSSMASLAGYKSILLAASILPKYFPMLITSAGSVKPANVLVVGAGVAGLQAIATAKRLGAEVEATDTRAAAAEEVKSLGGKFIKLENATEAMEGGYGGEQTKEFIKNQQQVLSDAVAKADVIVCTALVRASKAPVIISKKMMENMKHGSVIIDLATSIGGNCEGSVHGEVVEKAGVTIVGDINFPSQAYVDASMLYSNNICNLITHITNNGDGKFSTQIDPKYDDEILQKSIIHRPKN